jgi:hypothetical protein
MLVLFLDPERLKVITFISVKLTEKDSADFSPRLGRVRLDVCFVNGKHAVFLDQYGNVKEALLK